jgi:ACS family tartrate transporter-like MFS transporter
MFSSTEISGLERRTLAKVKRHMLLYIIIGQLLYKFDASNIGFAQLTMGKEVALTGKVFGLASGVVSLAAFLMQIPAAIAFERLGAKRWLTWIMIGWGLVVFAMAFIQNGAQLIGLRFFLGVFEAGFVPGIYVLISIWFKGKNHGVAISALMIGLAITNIFGGPFSGWILGQHFFGLSGWRNLFLIDGVLTVAWAVIGYFMVDDSPETARWLKPDEQRFMAKYLSEYQADKIADGALEKPGFVAAFKDSRILMLLVAFTLTGWVSSTFVYFIPTLLKMAGNGLSNQAVGFLSMGPGILIALVAYTWGQHADKTEPSRHWHAVVPLLVCAAAILLYPVAKTPVLAMTSLALVQAGSTGFFVNFWPAANMIVGKRTIAKSTAIINSGNLAGMFLGLTFFGWAMDVTGRPTLGLYTCTGFLLVIFLIMNIFFLKYKAHLKQMKQPTEVLTN